MTKHWRKSTIPYFAVVQDHSEVHAPTFQIEARQPLVNADQSSTSNVLSDPKNSYPEIRYFFEDDPDYYTLEAGIAEDEDAIVVELDEKGQEIRSATSLTADLQILNVRMKDKNYTKTIEIEITRPELSNTDVLQPDKNEEYIKKLVELYKFRNTQLEMLLQGG